MRNTTPLLMTVALLTTTGCMSSATDMRGFDNCSQLSRYMKTAEFRGSLDNAFNAVNVDFSSVLIAGLDENGSPVEVTPNEDPWSGATTFTGTNIQHDGVQESDLVKTDGAVIYAISGGKLVVSQAWPAEDAKQLSVLDVDGSAVGLYHYDGTVVVVSVLDAGEAPAPRSGVDPFGEDLSWRDVGSIAVTVVDAVDPTAPEVVRESYTTGTLRETRRVGDYLYVVTSENVSGELAGPPEETVALEDVAAQWLPVRFDNVLSATDWDVESRPACDCEDVMAPAGGTETIVTSVLVIDLLDAKATFHGTGIVGPAGVVYASPTALYLANTELVDPDQFVVDNMFLGEDMASDPDPYMGTKLHKFTLGDIIPEYMASTSVKGVLPDRFGLSEHEGVLRVATLEVETMTSGITTLTATPDTGFIELDHYGDLAPGEDLTAARFVGDLGYLVTYVEEKGDPLFSFDLSDPENITYGGELDLPGWSDYLHPMDEPGKLFAVGMDQEWNGDWVLSTSIFDVSDLSQPRLHDRVLFEGSGSEAATDHHAFTYDPESGIVVIPSWADNGETVLEVMSATAGGGIQPIGQVTQAPMGSLECVGFRRSILMDGIVYGYSTGGLTAAPVEAPEQTIQSVAFEGTDPCEGIVASDDDAQTW